ncbi:hypothetical protein E1B28_004676 [Marasmius oreades]|uniref:RING-type domain-containing protein n=1 Tax=Marasmius oreades TaxID=181124 RepID=A0A9P7UZ30_9AGAR|nr:uncharacterized protein E1B28_004676 [Marasmius oreades]KAG7097315.1 hypothetical protein E1B28_004676 [Marasmius oreades]
MKKGKERAETRTRKRVRETDDDSSTFEAADSVPAPFTSRSLSVATTSRSSSPGSQRPLPKRSRHRAETRECPICHEPIPLRLLGKHAELESSRVQDIISNIGSLEPITMTTDFDLGFYIPVNEASSSTTRRSAARARQIINGDSTSNSVTKTIQTIKRNRKLRYVKLREMTRNEEDTNVRLERGVTGGDSVVCPVCLTTVRGDEDVVNAHVDACLVNETRGVAEERQRQPFLEQEVTNGNIVDGDGAVVGYIGDVRGTGFHTRDRNARDVEDEVDVDGDDAVVYGAVQFTEGDILPLNDTTTTVAEETEEEPRNEGSEDQPLDKTLRSLVAQGRSLKRASEVDMKARMDEIMGIGETDKMELAILAARREGSHNALVVALENKIKQLESTRASSTSLLCRICIDPYNEPTVSTGCWHTCCRDCWLRCLGSTKLCPICKRITAATDLRRVYL